MYHIRIPLSATKCHTLTDIVVLNWKQRGGERFGELYLKRGLSGGNSSLLHFSDSLLQFSAQYKGATATLWEEDHTLILEEEQEEEEKKNDGC